MLQKSCRPVLSLLRTEKKNPPNLCFEYFVKICYFGTCVGTTVNILKTNWIFLKQRKLCLLWNGNDQKLLVVDECKLLCKITREKSGNSFIYFKESQPNMLTFLKHENLFISFNSTLRIPFKRVHIKLKIIDIQNGHLFC